MMDRSLRLAVLTAVAAGGLVSVQGCGPLTGQLHDKASASQVQTVVVKNTVTLPDAAKVDAIVVTVRRDGRLLLGETETQISNLAGQLRAQVGDRVNRSMFLRPDAHVRYRVVEDVIDSMQTAGGEYVGVGVLTNEKAATPRTNYFACGKAPETHEFVAPLGIWLLNFADPEMQRLFPTRIVRSLGTTSAADTAPGNSSSTVVVSIQSGAGGAPVYKINQTSVTKAELQTNLTAIYAHRDYRILFILGNDDLDFAAVAEVIDIAYTSEVDHIGLLTPRVLTAH